MTRPLFVSYVNRVATPSNPNPNPPSDAFPRSPFQKTGTTLRHEITYTNHCIVQRIDMPGCDEKDLSFWYDETTNMVHFFVDEPDSPQYGHIGRKYGGSIINTSPEIFNSKEAKAELKNGVLYITIPSRTQSPN